MTERLDPGPELRAKMLASGQNISPHAFTADERAEMAAETTAVRQAREWKPISELQADAS